MTASRAESFEIGGRTIPPGGQLRFDLPTARLPTHTELALPLSVLNGRLVGPRLWLSAAVHGDEVNGVEIIRRVLDRVGEELHRGTLIAAPIINVFGFIGQSRYLPDRRDLNRSFPGSNRGSLASRIAHLFLNEVVARCTHGIDLHTGSHHRSNLPQVRGDLEDAETRRLAEAFGAPVMLQSRVRDGSLRGAAAGRGAAVLVYEGGESCRFNEGAIAAGVHGVLAVLHELGMVKGRRRAAARRPIIVRNSTWVRARRGGILRLAVGEGDLVRARQEVGVVAGPFGEEATILRSPHDGMVIGRTLNPVVHGGDAVLHVGRKD